jgi:hypothetical protein
MYQLSGKTSKQILKSLMANGRYVVAHQGAKQQALVYSQAMNFFVVNKSHIQVERSMIPQGKRSFSVPPHIKLEMPNLSPTMEKVLIIKFKKYLGKHRKMA